MNNTGPFSRSGPWSFPFSFDDLFTLVRFNHNSIGKKRPPNYMLRREQRKVLMLVMTLGLVVAMVFKAADPGTWSWMWAGGDQRSTKSSESQPYKYDTRLRPHSPDHLPLDTFVAMAANPKTKDTEHDYLPGVEPQHLDSIKEHTRFRPAERDAWFNLLEVVNEADPAELKKASLKEVTFIQMFEQPLEYRGRPITLRGLVKRAFDIQAPKNDRGIETYYEIWMFPKDGPITPIVIYSLNLPEGFPNSRRSGEKFDNLHESVEVTGIFFKNWAYGRGEQMYSAPLLLARNMKWIRQVAQEKPSEELTAATFLKLVAVSAVIGILVAFYAYYSSKKGNDPRLAGPAGRFQAQSLEALKDVDLGPDIAEQLRQMAEGTPDDEAAADSTESPQTGHSQEEGTSG